MSALSDCMARRCTAGPVEDVGIAFPASLRTVPANLSARCVGRRVVGYPHSDLWPDELIVTRDTVYGYEGTLRTAGVGYERADAEAFSIIHLARMAWPNAHRPDGRLFYTIEPETADERAGRGARIKAETKHLIAGVRAGQKRDAAKAAGVIEMF